MSSKLNGLKQVGNKKITTVEESFEIIPFSDFSDHRSSHFNANDFYLSRLTSMKRHCVMNEEKIISSTKGDPEVSTWFLVSINSFEQGLKDGTLNLQKEDKYFITNSDYESLSDRFSLEKFINENFSQKLNPQKALEKNEKMRIIEHVRNARNNTTITIFRLEDGSLISSGYSLNINSDHFNLTNVIDKLLANDKVEILSDHFKNYKNNFINKKEIKNLNSIIKDVPYYNQNEDGNLTEIKIMYYPSEQELNRLLTFDFNNSKDSFDWVVKPENKEIDEKLRFFHTNKMLAFSLNLLEDSLEYQKLQKIKNKTTLKG